MANIQCNIHKGVSQKKEVLDSSSQMILLVNKALLTSQLNTLYGLHEGAVRNLDINYMLSTLDVMMDIAIDLNSKDIAERLLNKIESIYGLSSKLKLGKLEKEKFNEIRERIKEFSKITEKAFDSYNKTNAIT